MTSPIHRQPAATVTEPPTTGAASGDGMPGRAGCGWWSLGPARILVRRHDPLEAPRGVVVVLAPPSNEALTTHRTERHLAARLVDAGFSVVRAGLTQTSYSALASPDDRPLVQRWEDETVAILDEAARRYGADAVSVVSTRLGATLALNAAHRTSTGVAVAVAIAPVGSGRQYLRATSQLLAIAAAGSGLPAPFAAEADGSVPTYGMTLDPASAEHLRGYVLGADAPAGVAVHVLGGRDKPLDKAVRAYCEQPGVERHDVDGLGALLDRVSSFAVVPGPVLDEVVAAVERGGVARANAPGPDEQSAVVVEAPKQVRCEVVDVAGMPGLLTLPAGEPTRVLVWSPGATEPSEGPAGLWPHLARRLALRGVATLTFDLADSGERTSRDHLVDAYPYENERVAELAAGVRWANERLGLVPDIGGLCAGAWLAVAAVAQVPVRTVLPVNLEQWTGEPSIIERVEPHPVTGAMMRNGVLVESSRAVDSSEPTLTAPAPRLDRAALAGRARALLKERMPYRARVELGRRGSIQAPQPFLEAATAHGARVRVLLTQRDFSVLTGLHGYAALAALSAKGRDVLVEVDSNTDHGMVTDYSRERVVEFVQRALTGEDIFY